MMSSKEVEQLVVMLRLAEGGQLDSLPCPKCGALAMSVLFTNPVAERYFGWFDCKVCGNHAHINYTRRPAHFSEARRSAKFEALDRDIIAKAEEALRKHR